MRHASCVMRLARQATHNTRHTTQNALTFIELLLVIALIAVAAGISLPNIKNTFHKFSLQNFSGDLLSFMNYLRERSIVEAKIISLAIDSENRTYSAGIWNTSAVLKTYTIPEPISIAIVKDDAENPNIRFYPDGHIDKVSITISNPINQNITLTTEGVFGRVKIKE